jgi:hypothetical protein
MIYLTRSSRGLRALHWPKFSSEEDHMVDSSAVMGTHVRGRDHITRHKIQEAVQWLGMIFYNIPIMKTNSGVPWEIVIPFPGQAPSDLMTSYWVPPLNTPTTSMVQMATFLTHINHKLYQGPIWCHKWKIVHHETLFHTQEYLNTVYNYLQALYVRYIWNLSEFHV